MSYTFMMECAHHTDILCVTWACFWYKDEKNIFTHAFTLRRTWGFSFNKLNCIPIVLTANRRFCYCKRNERKMSMYRSVRMRFTLFRKMCTRIAWAAFRYYVYYTCINITSIYYMYSTQIYICSIRMWSRQSFLHYSLFFSFFSLVVVLLLCCCYFIFFCFVFFSDIINTLSMCVCVCPCDVCTLYNNTLPYIYFVDECLVYMFMCTSGSAQRIIVCFSLISLFVFSHIEFFFTHIQLFYCSINDLLVVGILF